MQGAIPPLTHPVSESLVAKKCHTSAKCLNSNSLNNKNLVQSFMHYVYTDGK